MSNQQEEALQIRKCRESDIVSAGEFYDRIVRWLTEHINYPRWVYGEYPSEAYVREKTKNGEQYLCVVGNRIIGAFALDRETPSWFHNGCWSRKLEEDAYLVLHAFAVDLGMQRQGVGSKILRSCVETAQSEGNRAIRLDIVSDNLPSRRFFEKNGFTFAGETEPGPELKDIPAFSLYERNW